MAYDDALADRVRDQLAPEPAVTEKAMFGGLAFWFEGVSESAWSRPAKG